MSKLLSSIGSESGFRAEIQGLRAVAIALVLIFHVWPESISGGYVGVDVFFVISGYLITRVLFHEYSSTGRIDVARFYERRIRRLMPAATLVLLASTLLLFLLPTTQREDGAKSVIASAVYVQNWWLANQAVDYLAAESAPGLLNHFWSLSVEEQYYIFWPVMVFAVGSIFIRAGKTHARAFTTLVMVVLLVSLIYSIWLTETNPQRAYFSTFTRAWELAIGGLLAVTTTWQEIDRRWRNLLGLAGLALILVSAFFYDSSTAFPGYAALLPTVGAALIVVAGKSDSFFSAYRVMALKPMQMLGDVSYSLYLWHWPVIITYSVLVGRQPGVVDGLALIAVSFALAYTTKALFEDRYRHHGHPGSRRNAFLMAAGCIFLSCVAGLIVWFKPGWTSAAASSASSVGQGNVTGVADNPGADALWQQIAVNPVAPIIPSLDSIKQDMPSAYLEKCISRGTSDVVKVCRYGDSEGVPVVLIGDAYALQWQPVLADLAIANKWDLQVISKTGCLLGSIPRQVSGMDEDKQQACVQWQSGVIEKLRGEQARVVFVAQNPSPSMAPDIKGGRRQEVLAEGLERFSKAAFGDTTSVIYIRSVPNLGKECGSEKTLISCSRPISDAIQRRDPALLAADTEGRLLLDAVDGICGAESCEAVVGNVIVNRSPGLLSATYARSMGGFLAEKLNVMGIFDAPLKVGRFEYAGTSADMVSAAMAAKRDNPDLYADGCHLDQTQTEPRSCSYGPEDADINVVLVGDSHSAQWLPALQDLAFKRSWRIHSFTKSACSFTDAVILVAGREYTSCTEWNEKVLAEIATLKPQFILMSQSRGHNAYGTDSPDQSLRLLSDGLVSRWRRLQGMGVQVIVVEGTPWMDRDTPDCVSSAHFTPGSCDTPLDRAYRLQDAIAEAHRKYPSVEMVSINGEICDSVRCHAVLDGKVIFRDRHHLTASFARSLSGHIEKAADAVLN